MFIRSGFTVVGLILPIAAASAQTPEPIERPIPPKAHERASDPYMPPVDAGVTEPASYPRGGPTPGVQVNTNSNGNNILGDAANEPSIGIDPTRPWRIAVGWRQFDNVASNFRQAGWAYSRDSGRTWTFPGRLTPGIFRSDPVLAADTSGVFYYSSLKQTFEVDFFKSNDGGRTWGSPIPAFGGDKQWFTIDTTGGIGNGNLYMCWSQYAGCCGTNVFTRSINAAATWSTPQALPRGHVFGTLDVGPNGDLFIVGSNANAYGIILSKSTNADDPSQPVTIPTTTDVNLGGDLSFGDPNLNPAGLLGQVIVAADRSGGPMNGYVYVLASVTPACRTRPSFITATPPTAARPGAPSRCSHRRGTRISASRIRTRSAITTTCARTTSARA
ncbi:MAG: exo-alpha-sialidase [Planctomycetes bacterium]|nr:exo-alpha-sialidase [Planctomycetota bacterium]